MKETISSRLKKLKKIIDREPSDPSIDNCQFLFECAASWSELKKTEDAAIRFCDQCQKNVYLCHTYDQLAQAISFNRCVAIYKNGSNLETLGLPIVKKRVP